MATDSRTTQKPVERTEARRLRFLTEAARLFGGKGLHQASIPTIRGCGAQARRPPIDLLEALWLP